jgi:hypothetical protein
VKSKLVVMFELFVVFVAFVVFESIDGDKEHEKSSCKVKPVKHFPHKLSKIGHF